MRPTHPNFIIAGFPKCGTTSLFYYLKDHPEVFIPHQKEINYFTQDILKSLNRGKGDVQGTKISIDTLEKYNKIYAQVKKESAIGDASPSYITFPECFEQIKQELNDPKIIIILRDPIKRAFSNYLHMVRLGREELDFYSALQIEDERVKLKYSPFWYYKTHSLYCNSISNAKDVFSNVLIILQEELNSKPSEILKRVYDFIDVDSNYIPSNISTKFNSGGLYKKNIVTDFFLKGSKFRSQLVSNFPIIKSLKPVKDKIISYFKVESPKIDKKTEDYLLTFFKEDVENLKKLGINTSYWNDRFRS